MIRTLHILFFGACCGTGMAVGQTPGSKDPIDQAVALVERTLDHLRQSSFLYHFTDQFERATAKHPCDVCPEVSLIGVEEYAFKVRMQYPDTFIFRHRIDRGHIKVELGADGRPVRVRVPFTKWLSGPSSAEGVGHLSVRRLFLIANVLVESTGDLVMETVLEEKPPGRAMTMATGSWGMELGAPTFGDGSVLAPDYTARCYSLGVEHYFHPFGTPNRRNIWLKAGLRLQWSHTRIVQDEALFSLRDQALSPATTPSSTMPQLIDLVWRVGDIEEQVRTIGLVLPMGLSKRWALGDLSVLALDLEVAVGRELNNAVIGRYRMDQHGEEHRIGGMLMRQSNGEALVYTHAPASVLLESGERIDFFSDRQDVLDGLEIRQRSTLSFGLSPSVFISNRKEVVYRVGLNLSFARPRSDTGTILDQTYFLASEDNNRPLLSAFAKNGYRPWAGLFFAIKL